MNRSKTRELAFKLLYQAEMQKSLTEADVELFLDNICVEEIEVTEEVTEYITDIALGTVREKDSIHEAISKNIKKDWEMDRISKINTALLKLAIYEIVHKQIPYKVAINEAIELAKKYGEETSPGFVNGILASVVKLMQ